MPCQALPSFSTTQNSTGWLFGLKPSTILCHNMSGEQCRHVCKHMERVVLNMQCSDLVFLQNNCPIDVHQAMTKEQKGSISIKGILGTNSQNSSITKASLVVLPYGL